MFGRAFKRLNSNPVVNLAFGESLDPALCIFAIIGLSCLPLFVRSDSVGSNIICGVQRRLLSVLRAFSSLLSAFHLDGILPTSGNFNSLFAFICSDGLNI